MIPTEPHNSNTRWNTIALALALTSLFILLTTILRSGAHPLDRTEVFDYVQTAWILTAVAVAAIAFAGALTALRQRRTFSALVALLLSAQVLLSVLLATVSFSYSSSLL